MSEFLLLIVVCGTHYSPYNGEMTNWWWCPSTKLANVHQGQTKGCYRGVLGRLNPMVSSDLSNLCRFIGLWPHFVKTHTSYLLAFRQMPNFWVKLGFQIFPNIRTPPKQCVASLEGSNELMMLAVENLSWIVRIIVNIGDGCSHHDLNLKFNLQPSPATILNEILAINFLQSTSNMVSLCNVFQWFGITSIVKIQAYLDVIVAALLLAWVLT